MLVLNVCKEVHVDNIKRSIGIERSTTDRSASFFQQDVPPALQAPTLAHDALKHGTGKSMEPSKDMDDRRGGMM